MKQLAGRSVLHHVVSRVSAASLVDEVIVATSTRPEDDLITAFCNQNGWCCMRGAEIDVLSRFAEAAMATQADIVARITSDCPLFSPKVLDSMLMSFDASRMDYMSTNWPQRSFPVGLDCEVMRGAALQIASSAATDPYDREHVTPFFYHNTDRFNVTGHHCSADLQNIRITLDTQEDYDRLVVLIEAHPELLDPTTDVLAVVQPYFCNGNS